MPESTAISACPSDEVLLAYLTKILESDAAQHVDAHVDVCDVCLGALWAAQQRLSRDAEMAEPVPAAVLQRLAAVPPQRAAMPAGDPTSASPMRRVRRLPVPPPLRVLLPLALAASVMLVIASQPWWNQSPQRPVTRAVPMSQQLRVSAHQAPVRLQPHLQAEVIATLSRGDVVEVGGEDREWYRVVLPDGGQGWVEQQAFR